MRGFSKVGDWLSKRRRARKMRKADALMAKWERERLGAQGSARAMRRAELKAYPRHIRVQLFGRHRRPSELEIARNRRKQAVSNYRAETRRLVRAAELYPELLEDEA